MAKKGMSSLPPVAIIPPRQLPTLFPSIPPQNKLANLLESQISHDSRASRVNGTNWILQNPHSTKNASSAEYAEIRSCRYVLFYSMEAEEGWAANAACNLKRNWGRTPGNFRDIEGNANVCLQLGNRSYFWSRSVEEEVRKDM